MYAIRSYYDFGQQGTESRSPPTVFGREVGAGKKHTVQLLNSVSEMFENASYNPVFARMNFNTDLSFIFCINITDCIGSNESIFEFNTSYNFV